MNSVTQQDTVATLMIPLARYPHIRADAPIHEAILLIHKGLAQPELSGFRRALVLGQDNVLIGFVNMSILLLGLEPDVLRTQPGGTYEGYASKPGSEHGMAVEIFWDRMLNEGFGQEPDQSVGEVAQAATITVTPEDKLARALQLMLSEKLLALPVVKNHQVLGVIRLIEIFERVVQRLAKTS